ncbi:alanine racemase [Bradyrhizobium sp. GM5.1]
MSRLGFAPAERAVVRMEIAQSPELEILYVMSHLASADEPTKGQNAAQLAEMLMVTQEFAPVPFCFANSAGVLMGKDYHGALVRSGIALYGGAAQASVANPMEPVVSLSIAVAQTRTDRAARWSATVERTLPPAAPGLPLFAPAMLTVSHGV